MDGKTKLDGKTALTFLAAVLAALALLGGCVERGPDAPARGAAVSSATAGNAPQAERNSTVSVPGIAVAAPTDADPAPPEAGLGWQTRLAHSRPVFGTVKTVDDQLLVITPEQPPAAGREGGQAPAPLVEPGELRIQLTAETVYEVDGVEQESNPFAAGDEVVVWIEFDAQLKLFEAVLVIDRASYAAMWNKGSPVWGSDVPGEPEWMMPVYGTIAALSETSITIDTDMPGIFRSTPPQDGAAPLNIPQSLTYIIDAETKWIVDGLELNPAAFSVGDKATVMPRQTEHGDPASAGLIADIVSKGDMLRNPQEGLVDAPPAGGAAPVDFPGQTGPGQGGSLLGRDGSGPRGARRGDDALSGN